jgi:Flp pilus assembly protein TadD
MGAARSRRNAPPEYLLRLYPCTSAAVDAALILESALAHHRAGRIDEAETCYRRLLDASPRSAEALHGLGLVARARGDLASALDLLEEAAGLQPSNAVYWSNLAAVSQQARVIEHARECAQRAVAIDPSLAEAQTNYANALAALGDAGAAEARYREALALAPTPRNRVHLALIRLLQGDYAEGWPLYEARLEQRAKDGDAEHMLERLRAVPRWRGEPLDGRRILIWTEQGLGDTIMMLRYLPRVRERGARHIAVCCEPELVRLVSAMRVADDVFSDTSGERWAERFDVHTPTMSLPLAFGTTIETLPRSVRYLAVPDALAATWTSRTAALRAPRVGLAWAGGRKTSADPLRSIPLDQFAPVLAVRGVTFVSLQKGPAAGERARVRRPIADYMDACRDLADTAALIDALDLVISVDTAVAHLAAALGKPTWLLNRRSSEWRWLLGRSDSPWYPRLRIFRQREAAWTSVINEVAGALGREVAKPRGIRGVWSRVKALRRRDATRPR